jgi:mannose/cellobiose epimerase-like protein (N-acyl-D-glucosamine 2-epimerase family)
MIVAALRQWLITEALPLWAGPARDPASGAPFECLMPDGSPDRQAVIRSRVPARQIYVYAHAAVLGWRPAGAEEALGMFDWLMARAHAPDGDPGFVHRLRPDGGVVDARRDAYDHAFMVLAFAWLARATGEARVYEALEGTLAFIDAALTLPDGSLREDLDDTLPRRQNPHMHMFEAMMGLHQALGRKDALKRAGALLALIRRHFISEPDGMLGEFFDAKLDLMDGPSGQVAEPGHLAEWTWLLRSHERIAGQPPGALADAMMAQALVARDRDGPLIDETDRAGRPVRRTRRLWPQTELAKGFIGQAEIGRPGAAAEALRALADLKRFYIDPAPKGAWIDQLDADGRVISDRMPASSLYHIFVAIAEADRVLSDV